ncbi:concanavalin A-like lectin/glucanase [Wallemia mellicola]|nr:concanavalin A-like lectin/glucanase [Wallemia mellicola]TIC19103.1 concanavalin A-like lectin/glucanase [Wallemia mellicola]
MPLQSPKRPGDASNRSKSSKSESQMSKLTKLPPRTESKTTPPHSASAADIDIEAEAESDNLATPPARRIASASQSYGLRNDAAVTPTKEPQSLEDEIDATLNNSNVGPDTIAVARGELGANLGPYASSEIMQPSKSNLSSTFTAPIMQNEDTRYSRYSTISTDIEYKDSPYRHSIPATVIQKKEDDDRVNTNLPFRNALFWDHLKDDTDMDDDGLHTFDVKSKAPESSGFYPFSGRGWLNFGMIGVLIGALLMLFAGYPILSFFRDQGQTTEGAYNLGGINATGQIPVLPGVRGLVDDDTPEDVKHRVGYDGKNYKLVFSDEFEQEGRTFFPGEDPFFEAVNIWYWPTGDMEWYSPEQVMTRDGALEITMENTDVGDLHYKSGMVQSWNKFCFSGGIIEFAIQLPGRGDVSGFWPGAWTMGNLGRPGYGASTEGTWPYSYDSCDVGTMPNQTNKGGTGPIGALNSNEGNALSVLPGQKLSSCTCKGEDHPGPHHSVGRGAPEIDALEAQTDFVRKGGAASQSGQFAPFDYGYDWRDGEDYTPIYDRTNTELNSYKGGVYQEAVSGVTFLGNDAYELTKQEFMKFGFEYSADPKTRDTNSITWFVDDDRTWTMNAAAVGPDERVEIGQRLVSEEPMSIIMNFGMADGFSAVELDKLNFPATMRVDYVRIYQPEDHINVGCNPPSRPTTDYINDHLDAYMNANVTQWEKLGYSWPKSSFKDEC